jgi:hypothetical protein
VTSSGPSRGPNVRDRPLEPEPKSSSRRREINACKERDPRHIGPHPSRRPDKSWGTRGPGSNLGVPLRKPRKRAAFCCHCGEPRSGLRRPLRRILAASWNSCGIERDVSGSAGALLSASKDRLEARCHQGAADEAELTGARRRIPRSRCCPQGSDSRSARRRVQWLTNVEVRGYGASGAGVCMSRRCRSFLAEHPAPFLSTARIGEPRRGCAEHPRRALQLPFAAR